MSKEGIHVFVRVRPPISDDLEHENAVVVGGNVVSLSDEKHDVSCTYEHVFPESSSQQEVFEYIQPLIDDVLNGYNGCIFAYGQTSAGKTYTMLGKNGGSALMNNSSEWGLLPRTSYYLFEELHNKVKSENITFSVKASFLQLYNECIYDLLNSQIIPTINHNNSNEIVDNNRDDPANDAGLKIRETVKTNGGKSKRNKAENTEVYVSGLSEFRVHSAKDILKLLSIGATNRATRSTSFNESSSRSHAILTISVEIEVDVQGTTNILRSKL